MKTDMEIVMPWTVANQVKHGRPHDHRQNDMIVELLSNAPEASKLFVDGGYGGPSLRDSLAQQVRWT